MSEQAFLKNILLGAAARDLQAPPNRLEERAEFADFMGGLKSLLKDKPADMPAGLRELGAYSLAAATEDGGEGFSLLECGRALGLAAGRGVGEDIIASLTGTAAAQWARRRFGGEEQRARGKQAAVRLLRAAAAGGAAKARLEDCRRRAADCGRRLIGQEDVSQRLADMASRVFAMDAVFRLAGRLAADGDFALEAAAAAGCNAANEWAVLRGTAAILDGVGAGAGGEALAREDLARAMRAALSRGETAQPGGAAHEVLAREATDHLMRAAGTWIDPSKTFGCKLRLLLPVLRFYALWYPLKWLGWGWWPRFRRAGRLAAHLRFAERCSRRLARAAFHGMLLHGTGLSSRQAFLFRIAELSMEIFAMAAVVERVRVLYDAGDRSAANAEELADLFCRGARRRAAGLLRDLWGNEDVLKRVLAHQLLSGRYVWLEDSF